MLQNSFAQHDKPYGGKECSDQTAFISMTTLKDFIHVKIVQHNNYTVPQESTAQ